MMNLGPIDREALERQRELLWALSDSVCEVNGGQEFLELIASDAAGDWVEGLISLTDAIADQLDGVTP